MRESCGAICMHGRGGGRRRMEDGGGGWVMVEVIEVVEELMEVNEVLLRESQ